MFLVIGTAESRELDVFFCEPSYWHLSFFLFQTEIGFIFDNEMISKYFLIHFKTFLMMAPRNERASPKKTAVKRKLYSQSAIRKPKLAITRDMSKKAAARLCHPRTLFYIAVLV